MAYIKCKCFIRIDTHMMWPKWRASLITYTNSPNSSQLSSPPTLMFKFHISQRTFNLLSVSSSSSLNRCVLNGGLQKLPVFERFLVFNFDIAHMFRWIVSFIRSFVCWLVGWLADNHQLHGQCVKFILFVLFLKIGSVCWTDKNSILIIVYLAACISVSWCCVLFKFVDHIRQWTCINYAISFIDISKLDGNTFLEKSRTQNSNNALCPFLFRSIIIARTKLKRINSSMKRFGLRKTECIWNAKYDAEI